MEPNKNQTARRSVKNIFSSFFREEKQKLKEEFGQEADPNYVPEIENTFFTSVQSKGKIYPRSSDQQRAHCLRLGL